MLTERQTTETALRLIDAELDRLARYDRGGQIGELLCEHHCATAKCSHSPAESAQEMRAVHQEVRDAVATLRIDLARYAAARNITIPATN